MALSERPKGQVVDTEGADWGALLGKSGSCVVGN